MTSARGAPATTPTSADPGLFGPDSVTWRVMREPVSFIGGLRALLQQSLHPDVVAGFDARSDYRKGPWPRLQRTAEYVAVATFGTAAQAEESAAHVRRVHTATWTDPASGRSRRLDEPDLLRWVHVCLVDSFLDVTTRAGLDLTRDQRDRFVSEQVRMAQLVGLPADEVPATTGDLADYVNGMNEGMPDRLRLTPAAIDAVALLLAPPIPVRVELLTPARLGLTTLATLAYGSLPSWARDRFPIPDGLEPLTTVAVTAGLRAVRTAGRVVQAAVPAARYSPHEAAARQRLGLDLDLGLGLGLGLGSRSGAA